MRLYFDGDRTRRVLRTLKDNGGVSTMWKVLNYKNGELRSFRKNVWWKSGWNISSRKSANLDYLTEIIYGEAHWEGIHVFTNKHDAFYYMNQYDNKLVVVPVEVAARDFVVAGYECPVFGDIYNALFTKVFLKKEDYDKAIEKMRI